VQCPATHDRTLVAGAGQRFESARRLSLFGIGRPNYPRKVRFQKFRLSGLWFLVLKALRAAERKRNGKDSNRSAAIADSQSIKTTEESAG
jgi:hypothetical protein